MSKLLINEPPLQVLPSLAVAVGLQEAIVLQQVHYWLGASRNVKDGRKWVYNTYEQWAEQFPFWKPESIRKIFKSLRDQGLIIAMQADPQGWNKTNFYSINYEALELIPRPEKSTGRPEDSTGRPEKSTAQTGRFHRMDAEDSTASLTETSHKTSQETTQEKEDDFVAPPLAGAICMLMKSLGIPSVNPNDPDLKVLIAADTDIGLFADVAKECVKNKKPSFRYVLAVVKGRMKAAAELAESALAAPEAANETSYERAARIRMEEVSPRLARKVPGSRAMTPTEFLEAEAKLIEVKK